MTWEGPDLESVVEAAADREESQSTVDLTSGVAANDKRVELLGTYGSELEVVREEIDSTDAQLKALKERKTELEAKLIPDLMRNMGIVSSSGKGSFTTSTGGRISLRTEVHVGCKAEDKQALFDALRATGNGDLIKQDVHPATLKSWVKELMSDGKPVPKMITTFTETKAVLTRGKKD